MRRRTPCRGMMHLQEQHQLYPAQVTIPWAVMNLNLGLVQGVSQCQPGSTAACSPTCCHPASWS